jgi:hypothetical protein
MRHCKQCSENHAKSPNNNVGNAQERVLTSHDGSGRDDNGLGTAVHKNWEVYSRVSFWRGNLDPKVTGTSSLATKSLSKRRSKYSLYCTSTR